MLVSGKLRNCPSANSSPSTQATIGRKFRKLRFSRKSSPSTPCSCGSNHTVPQAGQRRDPRQCGAFDEQEQVPLAGQHHPFEPEVQIVVIAAHVHPAEV